MHPRKYFTLNFLSMKYFLSKNFGSYFLILLSVLLECFMASTSMDGACIGLHTCIMITFTVFI